MHILRGIIMTGLTIFQIVITEGFLFSSCHGFQYYEMQQPLSKPVERDQQKNAD